MISGDVQRPHVVLIIPTLNERDNILSIIQAFLKLYDYMEVLVADSDSSDGTAQLVIEADWGTRRVHVLPCARRQGRGAAIVEAYRALRLRADVTHVAIADVDFSHDPADFTRLWAALDHADVVIGSRYVPGSKIIGWPLRRRLFSLSANWLARLFLRLGVRDYTNGYRLMTWPAMTSLNLDQLDADGFIMLSQELVQWHQRGWRLAEVPTTFVNRQRGQSHFRLRLVWESLVVLSKLVRQREHG